MKENYHPLDLRKPPLNTAGLEFQLFSIGREISSDVEPVHFYQDDSLKEKDLGKIFTKTYRAPEVYYSILKECTIGPRLHQFQRYWPIFFGEYYVWNFLSSAAKIQYKNNGIFDINDDVISFDKSSHPTLKIPGISVWFFPFKNLDHLLRECLPTILLLKEAGVSLFDVNFLCTEIDYKTLDFLLVLGIPSSQIIIAGNRWIECESLILPCFGSFGHLHTPTYYYNQTLEFVLNKIKESNKFGSFDKIYVSRRNAKVRRVLNEAAIELGLKKRGFSIIEPGDYSLVDQINIFRHASFIVGPHGMGIANYGFSKKSANLMEIMQSDYPRVSYFRTAQFKNGKYGVYWALPTSLEYCAEGSLHGDILLSPNKFFNALDEFT